MKCASRRSSAAVSQVPDHRNRDDRSLGRFGSPDTLLLVNGHRLWAHYDVLCRHSAPLREELHESNVDPFWGRTLRIRNSPEAPRSVEGVLAWLGVIYPPQGLPPPKLLTEVDSLAREYRMETILHQMKLGIGSAYDLRNLVDFQQEAEEHGSTWPMPQVVIEALAEFSSDELGSMPGFIGLSTTSKLEVARCRVGLLEQLLGADQAYGKLQDRAGVKAQVARACVQSHPELFRDCPWELRWDAVRSDDGITQDEDASLSPSTRPSVTGSAYSTFSSEQTRYASGDRTRMSTGRVARYRSQTTTRTELAGRAVGS
mmetsp:Transcript_6299/g.14347  ORF Transcript_6299/g.14347 Transcript_6299/m.14347 type:complete len:315 (+) Transcript_6299:120-1064(+)